MIQRIEYDRSAAPFFAAGCVFFTLYPDLDNIGSSADPRIDRNGMCGTVGHTGSTFYAGIEIDNTCFLLMNFKNRMRANFGAQAAADAFVFI